MKIDASKVSAGIIRFGALVEGVADPHPRSAYELLLYHLRIEGAADFEYVLDGKYGHFAGLIVDFDIGDRAGVRVTCGRLHRAGRCIRIRARNQEDTSSRDRAALFEMRRQRRVEDRDRALRRSFDVDIAYAICLQVTGVYLQLFCCAFPP